MINSALEPSPLFSGHCKGLYLICYSMPHFQGGRSDHYLFAEGCCRPLRAVQRGGGHPGGHRDWQVQVSLGKFRVNRSLSLTSLVTNRGPVSGRADPVMIRSGPSPGIGSLSPWSMLPEITPKLRGAANLPLHSLSEDCPSRSTGNSTRTQTINS